MISSLLYTKTQNTHFAEDLCQCLKLYEMFGNVHQFKFFGRKKLILDRIGQKPNFLKTKDKKHAEEFYLWPASLSQTLQLLNQHDACNCTLYSPSFRHNFYFLLPKKQNF